MNIKIFFFNVLLGMLLAPVYASSHPLNTPLNLDCSLEVKRNMRECEVKPNISTSAGILKELMLIYRQQSQHNKMDVVIHIHKLEF